MATKYNIHFCTKYGCHLELFNIKNKHPCLNKNESACFFYVTRFLELYNGVMKKIIWKIISVPEGGGN